MTIPQLRLWLFKRKKYLKMSAIAKECGVSPARLSRWIDKKSDDKGTPAKISEPEAKQITALIRHLFYKL